MTLRQLKIIATVVPLAGFVDRMQNQLRRQNEELLALHKAGLAVAAELSLDVVLKTVVDQARNLVGARYGAVSVIDRERRIQQFVTSGVTPEQRAAIGPPPVGHGVLGVVLREGKHPGHGSAAGHVRCKAADAYLKRGRSEEASGQLRELAASAGDAYTDVREGIVGLRTLPDANQGVAEALRNYLDQWKAQTGISTELLVEGDVRVRPSAELQLVRIVQEALTNVRKHAKASRASVSLVRNGNRIIATVIDDGL